VEALTALRKRQLTDSAAAGTAYQAGLAVRTWRLLAQFGMMT